MEYLPISFVAGVLTVLAPCVLPVLPVVLGSSLQNTNDRSRPLIVTLALAISIVIFTLLLKVSTALIQIDPRVWQLISGTIIAFFGVITLFPDVWGWIEIKLGLGDASAQLLQTSSKRTGLIGNALVGISLGPVFASCSPTYAIILALIFPISFGTGLLNLIFYAGGLFMVMLLVALLGQRFLAKVKWIVNPHGWFKKILGILFILLGIAIATGFEKKIETALLDAGLGDVTNIETKLLERMDEN